MTRTTHTRLAGMVAGGGLLLAALVAPAAAFATQPSSGATALACDGALRAVCPVPAADEQPTDEQPSDEQPTDEVPTDEAPTDASPSDEGEVVYDPIFITPTPDATPVGEVLGVTGRPDVTPPATDAVHTHGSAAPGAGTQALLLVLAGLSSTVLLLGRVPAARRR